MNLYLISQTENHDFNTFDSAVVAAPDEASARLMNLKQLRYDNRCEYTLDWSVPNEEWANSPQGVTVKFIGVAAPEIEQSVICASFNSG